MRNTNPEIDEAVAPVVATAPALPEEEVMRADLYDLLAAFLARPPSVELLAGVARLEGDETPLGEAVNMLARLAEGTSEKAAEREFNAMFIGLGRGEVLPYGSYYMTGFLNEQPLARLRADMARLRITRAEDVKEPEDGLASLCEMMAGMIRGRFGEIVSLERQKEFFNTHIAPWAAHCFSDMENAEAAVLYAGVGSVGREFMEIEAETMRMI